MSSVKFIRAGDEAAIRERVESLRVGGTRLAIVVEAVESQFVEVVRTLLSKAFLVALYVQDPLQADKLHKRAAWNRTINIIDDFVGNGPGSLDVWLSPSMPFSAVWVEEEFVAFRSHTDSDLSRWLPLSDIDATSGTIVAGVGSREYMVLAEMLKEFAHRVFIATLGPAFVITRGEVTRAMGDH